MSGWGGEALEEEEKLKKNPEFTFLDSGWFNPPEPGFLHILKSLNSAAGGFVMQECC